jgi:anhydro-N-acetylmuramic acid kinase
MSRTAIAKLAALSDKPSRRIIGLMSGTSLDGLDIALCDIAGSGQQTKISLPHFITIPYPDKVKEAIRVVFAKPTIDFQQLCLLNPYIGQLHAQYILEALKAWQLAPEEIDCIASHGQTVYHSPRILHRRADYPNATLQIGDGDHLAVNTGIITLSDFRQKHCAAGGEGAPLALYGDYLVFSKAGEQRLMLNMGGIANFTYLPGTPDPQAVYVTDTGPGNTLIDAAARRFFQQEYDKDAAIARKGTVNQHLLQKLKADPFFAAPFPKTTGPELFSLDYVEKAQAACNATGIDPHDLIATLTRFSAETIADAILQVVPAAAESKIFMSGGGAHNPLLTSWLQHLLPSFNFHNTAELGIPGDAKEAVLFAILANETLAGQPIQFNKPGMPAITMGKISLP